MPTPTIYTYPISSLPNSSGADPARIELQVQLSAIITQIDPDGAVTVSNGNLTIKFKDVLPTADKLALDGNTAPAEEIPPVSGVLAEAGLEIPVGDDPTEVSLTPNTEVIITTGALGNTHFGRSDDNSPQMAIDGSSGGSDTSVWDGTGGSDTGADWAVTGAGQETIGAMHSGTNGWHTQSQSGGTSTKFNRGTPATLTDDSVSFWLQPKVYPGNATLRVSWANAAQAQVGNSLNVENYVTNMDLDVWQRVEIPLADFGLTGDVQFLTFHYNGAGTQRHFLDDILLHDSGGSGPYIFQAAPLDNTQAWHTTMLVLVLAASDTGWSSDAFANIVGGLANGLLVRHRRISTGEVLWSLNSKDNIDLFGRFHPQEDFTFSNNELLVGFMVKPGQSANVVVTDDDVLEVVVRDDLSGLNNIRAFLHYGIEVMV